jgi:hypothetical protein
MEGKVTRAGAERMAVPAVPEQKPELKEEPKPKKSFFSSKKEPKPKKGFFST